MAMSVLVAGCNAQYVDDAPALKVSDNYWNALRRGDQMAANDQYSPAFKAAQDQWPALLGRLRAGAGPVVSAELQEGHIVPLEEDPCYWLTIDVKRSGLASVERLLICRETGGKRWFIAGHAMERLDTHQQITGGFIPEEAGVRLP
jgi:hypothetical protein